MKPNYPPDFKHPKLYVIYYGLRFYFDTNEQCQAFTDATLGKCGAIEAETGPNQFWEWIAPGAVE